ncbi:N-acetylmuramic acid 6-phosphate etherase [Sphingomonas aracearum]|uniref:N-acetylmuramic acid 6-phosphate etherase n=1 Tax=Sphingomonas aracearum TaxID=2283317 RepID=A0A369VTX7_9SPHN|nr:N-acetylmuramic acid 6-phosphate etherase [Sphingomonas aracearum]RDE05818.1 N-acetylmuramic acid 6-phosphate etherase [Sphingomonas aracearum]
MSTEAIDPRFQGLECWPTEQAVRAMLGVQAHAIEALRGQTSAIADAAEAAATRLGTAGRLAYAGAGTSGRIGVQDGVELTPTFGWPERRLAFLVAGGPGALMRAVEGAEDDAEAGRAAVSAEAIGLGDVLIGIAASGRTPFVLAAVKAARDAGAVTVGLSNNPDTPLLTAADYPILADTGPEVLAGSTRMGAGTAQKAALNLLSTAIMLRLGFVHAGRMVNMRISNAKLAIRARTMVEDLGRVDAATAAAALEAAGGEIGRAVLIARGVTPDEAARLLKAQDGRLGGALEALGDA